MIYTITCNPSLDYVMHVKNFMDGETNRSYQEEIYPGGKGFNVSTILQRLGLDTTALGFIAGFTGQEIEKQLLKRGFHCQLCHVSKGMSRINVKMKSNLETEINGSGPTIEEENLKELYSLLDTLQDYDTLVLAGSIPATLPNTMYEDIMKYLTHKNIRILVDATNELLLKVLPYKPFLVKPNHRELEEIFNVNIENQETLIMYARKLQELGAKNVLVSLGGDGALLISEDSHVYRSPAAKGTLINSVGSGDSMVAGFLAGYMKSNDYKEALRLGSASGGATAFSHDLATKEKIDEVYQQIFVEVIE